MKTVMIADTTLCRTDVSLTFKEKMEICRILDRIGTDIIELPEITEAKQDALFVRTVSSIVKNGILSVAAGSTPESIERAASALSGCAHPRIRIELSVSTFGMEYSYHKKPQKMLDWITEAVKAAKDKVEDVEFSALDATRAEESFFKEAVEAAQSAGATSVSVTDSASVLFPDDAAEFAKGVVSSSSLPVGFACSDTNGVACAAAALSVKNGAAFVKTSVGGCTVPFSTFARLVKNRGESYGVRLNIKQTEVDRADEQIRWIINGKKNGVAASAADAESSLTLVAGDKKEDVLRAAAALGYDLSEEDGDHVYEEFLRVASKKPVGAKELEVIVATSALQAPAAYKLTSYVINNGNIITSSAQIALEKDGKPMCGISMGDGPVDAAFNALEQITGKHYELDDFQIQSVTEGTEAMASALVKLRSDGKLFSGNGVSTDIIGAGIRAYINAINKIVYEEDQK